MPQKCISEGTIVKNSFSKTVQRFPIGRIGGGIGTEMRSFEVVTERTMKLWENPSE